MYEEDKMATIMVEKKVEHPLLQHLHMWVSYLKPWSNVWRKFDWK